MDIELRNDRIPRIPFDRQFLDMNCTNTTIDIQNTLDEDGEIEKGSDGGRTTDDGGCVSDQE